MSLSQYTQSLISSQDLSQNEVNLAAKELLSEAINPDSKADFLKALAEKGETPDEITYFVENFLDRSVDPQLSPSDVTFPLIDVCGTGGDKLDLFNVSTTALFLLVANGVGVVKHGNRSITSKSGGADVLEALGVPIDLTPAEFAKEIKDHRFGFLFAPLYHPAFKAVGPVRAQLAKEGRRTIFNILGPLLNPVRPDYQLIGVFDESLTRPFAEILKNLNRKSAWIVHGKTANGKGVDEISTMGPTKVTQLKDGFITDFEIHPEDFGLPVATTADLVGGDADHNAEILKNILNGTETGPKKNIACLNAAAGLVVTDQAKNIPDALEMINTSITDGKAKELLSHYRKS